MAESLEQEERNGVALPRARFRSGQKSTRGTVLIGPKHCLRHSRVLRNPCSSPSLVSILLKFLVYDNVLSHNAPPSAILPVGGSLLKGPKSGKGVSTERTVRRSREQGNLQVSTGPLMKFHFLLTCGISLDNSIL